MAYETPITKFADKDALAPGTDAKRIRGSEFDAEFEAIAEAFTELKDEDGNHPSSGVPNGGGEGEILVWESAEWRSNSTVRVTPEGNVHVGKTDETGTNYIYGNTDLRGVFKTNASTVLGTENTDQHVIVGDTYIGYSDEANNLPDNNDVPGGTLFLYRGLIVGHENTGNASIKMNGNVIFELGDPVSDSCAVSKGYVERELVGDIKQLEEDVDTNEVNIVNMYNEQIKQALQIQGLQNAVNNMGKAIEAASNLDDLKQAIKDLGVLV